MEDGVSQAVAAVQDTTLTTPPAPPDPNVDDAKAATIDATLTGRSDVPLQVDNDQWDVQSVSGLGALRMLVEVVETLAEISGDVPPTPPVSRPSTPKRMAAERAAKRLSSTPRRAAGPDNLPAIEIGSPEAAPTEPITVDVGAHAQDIALQHAAIARRFFSKCAPPFSLKAYLFNINKHCPHSPGVYLAAAYYIYRLCLAEYAVPATNRTIHRLALAAIRVAAKAVEDNKWSQERIARVGGVSNVQLMNLEVTLCFLLDFDLFVDDKAMARGMYLLQQAARRGGHGHGLGKAPDQFQLRLPSRIKSTG